jgi:hypothetical protein
VEKIDPIAGKKPDAVLCPNSFKGTGRAASRLHRLEQTFGEVLGGKVFHRNLGDAAYLVHVDNKSDTLLFPTGHPREKEERYEWRDQGDGVLYGYRKPDDDAPNQSI